MILPRHRGAALLLLSLAAPLAGAGAQFAWGSPAARLQGWQEDFDSTLASFLPRDRSFDPVARARFVHRIRQLRDSIDHLSDEQLVTRLATAVAGANNAHTRLYLLRNRTSLRRYPVRVWWFGEELRIVRTRPELATLDGARIVALAGMPIAAVMRRVAPLYSGTHSWTRYMSSYLLTSPEILRGVGVLGASDSLILTVIDRGGRMRRESIAPMPFERTDQPIEAWWDLAPTHPGRQGPWTSVLPDDSLALPAYLRHLDRYYWWQRDTARRMVYVQYNRAQDDPSGENVASFGSGLLRDIRRDPPEKLVIDLRFNTGGNLQLADSLMRALAALPLARERGRLFVITGRTTFSAGITAVATLKQEGRAILVGEAVGDTLDFWAEGGNVLLHNTRLTLHFGDQFHSYSAREHPAFRPYAYDLHVASLTPDILVEPTFAEYLAGRDPAMEAIERRPLRASTRRRPAPRRGGASPSSQRHAQ